jgi:hypothetical protein
LPMARSTYKIGASFRYSPIPFITTDAAQRKMCWCRFEGGCKEMGGGGGSHYVLFRAIYVTPL